MIKKENVKYYYKLGPLQEGIFFHHLLEPNSGNYFFQNAFRIRGTPNIPLIRQSFKKMLERYDILRTVFSNKGSNGPIQIVLFEIAEDFKVLNFQNVISPHERLLAFKTEDRQMGFDMETGPLIRLAVVNLPDDEFELIWSHHHILMDGWCLALLAKEFVLTYKSIFNGAQLTLDTPTPYVKYIEWLFKIDQQASLSFWKMYLAGYDKLTSIEGQKAGSKSRSTLELAFTVEQHIVKKLTGLAKSHNFTLVNAIQALWATVLAKYNFANEVVFGLVVSGRPPEIPGIERMLGLFINTIPVRIKFEEGQGFISFTQTIQKNAAKAEPHHYVQLADVQAQTVLGRNLFDHVLVFENYPDVSVNAEVGNSSQKAQFEIKSVETFEKTNYDFGVVVIPGPEVKIIFRYTEEIYEQHFLVQLAEHFRTLIRSAAEHPNDPAESLEFLPLLELRQLLSLGQGPQVSAFDKRKIIHQFDDQAVKFPDKLAILYGENQYTYCQLQQRSVNLANYLRHCSAKQGDVIGVCLPLSDLTVTAILSVLRIGGIYMPVDYNTPAERVELFRQLSGCKLMMDEEFLAGFDTQETYSVLSEQHAEPEDAPMVMLYTSGSTGVPKGVLLTTGNVVNRLNWMWSEFPFTLLEVACLKTSIGFVDHIWELFGPLLKCIPLVVIDKETIIDSDRLVQLLFDKKVTRIVLVPSLLRAILELSDDHSDKLSAMKFWICSGEELPVATAEAFIQKYPQQRLLNIYGCTEVTADATYCDVTAFIKSISSADQNRKTTIKIPIGKPLWNAVVLILDPFGYVVPNGVPGEIYIGGDGVAEGYHRNTDLTASRFVNISRYHKGVLYKTGDMGRWLRDGNLEYLGRLDMQLKIRGQRIEIGEILFALKQSEYVKHAVVLPVKDQEGQVAHLVAYLEPHSNFNKVRLLDFLHQRLPEYMVPEAIVTLSKIPLLNNGKTDLGLLFKLCPVNHANEISVPPENSFQETIASMWCHLLGLPTVGIHDDFFELGGHSLLATRLVVRLRKDCGLNASVRDIFDYSTVEKLAHYLQSTEKQQLHVSLSSVVRPEKIPLSYNQELIWKLDNLDGTKEFHIPFVFTINHPLDLERLSEAFRTVIKRHEPLRTVIGIESGIPYQQALDANEWNMLVANFSEDEAMQEIESLVKEPFDLARDFMLRAAALITPGAKTTLVVSIHHIAFDDWSEQIFWSELLECYSRLNNGELISMDPLLLQFADYSLTERQNFDQKKTSITTGYWVNKLRNLSPLQIATDFPRAHQPGKKAVLYHYIKADSLHRAKKYSSQNRVTLFVTLLAAFKVVLSGNSGQKDICVGTYMANRQLPGTEMMVGFFANLVALRNNLDEDGSFADLIQQVNKTVLDAGENQGLPLQKVIQLNNWDVQPLSLLAITFVLHEISPNHSESKEDLTFRAMPFNNFDAITTSGKAYQELSVSATAGASGLQMRIEYNADLFLENTILLFFKYFEHVIELATDNKRSSLNQIYRQAVQRQDFISSTGQ